MNLRRAFEVGDSLGALLRFALLSEADAEMLRQRHKSRAGHVGPSNRTNFGSAENPAVSPEIVAVEPKLLRLNRRFLS